MAKKNELAKAESDELATAANNFDALAEFFDDPDADQLDVGADDIKIRSLIWNLGGVDKVTKQERSKAVFFDTISETTQATLDAVILLNKRSKRYDYFDNATDKTVVVCASSDLKTGRMSDGTERPCLDCPDDGWFTDPDTGKPKRKCGEVHTVVGIERLTQKPFVARFKKTSLKAFRNYMMAHHYKAHVRPDGQRVDVAWYAFNMSIGLVMHESGKYAVPVLTAGDVVKPAEFLQYRQSAASFKRVLAGVEAAADKHEAVHSPADADNMSADDFAD